VLHLVSATGVVITRFSQPLGSSVAAGQRMRLGASVENPLVPGRYFLDCWVGRDGMESGAGGVQGLRLMSFTVDGEPPSSGIVSVEADVEASLELAP